MTEPALYLVLDQGSHASRAMVFDRRGEQHAAASVPVDTRIKGDRVEQDPEQLVATLRDCAGKACLEAGAVPRAAGLATQRSSVVCWNRETGEALTPVLSWRDRRAADRLEELRGKASRVAHLTGLRLSPHYGASKLSWCLDNVPAVRQARRRGTLLMGPLSSFLLFRLLDERPALVDPANAARTLLYDRHHYAWSEELLADFGIPREYLPETVLNRHAFGHLRLESQGSLPLTVCTGDQSAALFAGGDPATGTVAVNIGTGAFLQQVLSAPAEPGELLAGLAWRGAAVTVHTLEGTVNGAGAALEWLARELAMAPEALTRMLPDALAGNEEPPMFVNGIGGVGSPFWKARIPTRFIGRGGSYGKGAAVVESMVFLMVRNLEQMAAQSAPAKRLTVTGGLSKLDGLCTRLSALSGLTVERPAHREATGRGLAWLVAGRPRDWGAKAAVQRFRESPGGALSRRYRRWTRAMRAATL